jgi:hypothetical protein
MTPPNYFRWVKHSTATPATYSYALDFSSANDDASGSIGLKTSWEKLIGTERGQSLPSKRLTHYPYFDEKADTIFVSSGSYWNSNLWNSNDGDLTLQAWVWPNGTSDAPSPRLLSWGNYNATNETSIYCGGYGTENNLVFKTTYNSQVYNYQFDAKLTPYTWNHVVVKAKVANDSDDFVEPILFLNGVKYTKNNSSTTVPSGYTLSTTNIPFVIGGTAQNNEQDHADKMAIRDVGVWNSVLSDSEITQLYNDGTIQNGYDAISSKQSLSRAYYELTGAVSAPYIGDYGNNTGYMDIGGANSYWNSNLASNSGEVTYMGWFKTNSNQSSQWSSLLGAGKFATNGTGDGWRINYDQNDEEIDLQITYGGNAVIYKSTATDIPENQWNHIAVTFKTGTNYGNGAGDTAPKIYINGVLDANSSTISSGYSAPSDSTAFTVTDTSTFLTIGKDRDSAHFDNAYFREVGIWNKILTAAEITTAYNGGEFRDNSTIQNGTCKGYWRMDTPTSGTGYGLFDGSGDKLKASHNTRFPERELASGANRGKVTFSAWAYSDWSLRSSKQNIMELGQAEEYYVNVVSGKVQLQVKYSATTVTYTWPSMSALTDDAFSHIVIVADIGKTYADRVLPVLYVNGSSQGNATESGTPDDSETWKDLEGSVQMGTTYANGDDFGGRLKHVAVWNKLLTSGEVTTLYNSGTPGDASTVHTDVLAWYWPLTSADSHARLNWYLDSSFTGDATITGITYTDSMSQNIAGATKIHHVYDANALGTFKDSSDSIATWDINASTSSENISVNIKDDAWAVMGWYKPSSLTVWNTIIEFGKAIPEGYGNVFYVNTTGELSYQLIEDDVTYRWDAAQTPLTVNEWNHIAAVVYPFRNSRSVEFYINGERSTRVSHTTRPENDASSTWDEFNRFTWNGVEKLGGHNSTRTNSTVGIGYANPPILELKGKVSELAVYQGALSHQAVSGAYNDGNFIAYPSGSVAYDVKNIVPATSDSWNLVGYWRMGDNGSDSSGLITDDSGQGNNLLYSSATVQTQES